MLSILLLVSVAASAQEDSTLMEFLENVIKRKSDSSMICYTSKLHPGMYDFMMEKILIKRKIRDISKLNKDKFILTSQEIKLLKSDMTEAKEQTWKEDLFLKSKRIQADSIQSFLVSDQNKELFIFSKPSFIRNNTVAFFYVVHLCCGGIYGPVDLSFYKKETSGWKRWIRIDGGAF